MDEIKADIRAAAGQPAGGAGDRPADLAPHRPHALGRALADRDQDLRRRPRRAARAGRRAARQAGRASRASPTCRSRSRCWRRRSRCASTTQPRAQYGVPAPQVLTDAAGLVEGEKVTQIVEGSRRFALVVRLPESARSVEGLAQILIETPSGRIPLSKIASIEDGDGPNQISRDDGKRRIVLSANAQGGRCRRSWPTSAQVVAETRAARGLLHHPGRPVPGAGGGLAPGRPAVDRLADADVRGAVQPLQVGACCRR